METRTAKIKSLKDYAPKKDGTKTIGITFDDGKFGYWGYKEAHGLVVGVEITYSYEDKVSSKGNDYQDISTIQVAQKKTEVEKESVQKPPERKTIYNQPKSLIELKADASLKAMQFIIDAFIADKINYDKIPEYYKEIKTYLFDALDEISQG